MGPASARIRQAAPTVSVGILTADLLSLGSEIALLAATGVPMVHFDVMDGCFCPMMTFGPALVKAVKTPLLKDVHLMIADPLDKIAAYVAAGADILTVHAETGPHIHRVFQALGKMANVNDPERGLVRGVALNPGTPLEAVEPLLPDVEMITLLAVNPGWSGQAFIPATRERLARTVEMIGRSGRDILLAVDGGVTRENIVDIAAMPADVIVTGSAVFDGASPRENASFMLEVLRGK